MIAVERIEIFRVHLPLVKPFKLAFGDVTGRSIVMVKMTDASGHVGWGEGPTLDYPIYKADYTDSAYVVLKDFIAPALLKKKHFDNAVAMDDFLNFVRGHYFAKAAISMAAYDLEGKHTGQTVASLLGGTRDTLTMSLTIPLQDSRESFLNEAQKFTDMGVSWIKLKVVPGRDLDLVEMLRTAHPDCKIMLDGNASYPSGSEMRKHFQRFVPYDIACLEQAFSHRDLVDHATLQSELSIPVSLDESIEEVHDCEQAIAIKSCRMVNVKVARVGGLTASKRIHDLCVRNNMPTWSGGMVEGPISLAASMAFATLPGCTMPVDFMDPYWYVKDFDTLFTAPLCTIDGDTVTPQWQGPGLGVAVDEKRLLSHAVKHDVVSI